METVLIVACE
jgi:hypothetical protein